jgi:hypothetical protein
MISQLLKPLSDSRYIAGIQRPDNKKAGSFLTLPV